ncbi:hypothetical protein [Nostoc commune]|uniref:hypothetical protein n=1 Tax=Nostoc commune TaxID=1178 RepID=UPI001E2D979E|nr:hypothetical protein [Nostoc commune]
MYCCKLIGSAGTRKTNSWSDPLELVEFDRKKAIASLDKGKSVIPVWLDVIYQQLEVKLEKQ